MVYSTLIGFPSTPFHSSNRRPRHAPPPPKCHQLIFLRSQYPPPRTHHERAYGQNPLADGAIRGTQRGRRIAPRLQSMHKWRYHCICIWGLLPFHWRKGIRQIVFRSNGCAFRPYAYIWPLSLVCSPGAICASVGYQDLFSFKVSEVDLPTFKRGHFKLMQRSFFFHISVKIRKIVEIFSQRRKAPKGSKHAKSTIDPIFIFWKG